MRTHLALLQLGPGPDGQRPKTDLSSSGSGFVDTNHPKVTQDYYVVRGSRRPVLGVAKLENPEGTIGGAPYASKKYATAALKKFPECKGGEATELEGKKHGKK